MSDNHTRYRSIRSALSQMFFKKPIGYGAKQLEAQNYKQPWPNLAGNMPVPPPAIPF
jgi:hypothetical protein